MARIALTELQVTGTNVPVVDLKFGSGLTVIHGASDTGKSYIFDAINYLLGASEIKEIPEAEGYTTASLAIRTIEHPAGAILQRPLRGKPRGFSVYDGPKPSGEPRRLAVQHSAKSDRNISSFLLRQLELHERRIRTSEQNETRSLSFRDVCQLVLINEADIVSLAPAPFRGQWTTRTTERSVLKVLLQGNDDSDLPLITKADIANRQRNEGKLSALQQVAESLRFTLAGGETEASLRERGERLQAAIDEVSAAMGEYIQEQAALSRAQREIQDEYNDRYRRLAELNDLTANFNLLARKYESDLERLGMLEEAGTLLGYFDVGTCVFCGALPENQSVQAHQVEDRSLFAESVRAEQEKTRSLRQDLEYAIGDLESEKRREESAIDTLGGRQRDVERVALELDDRIRPRQAELGELLSARSEVERRLAAYDQMRRVDEMRAAVPNPADMSSVPPSTIRDDTAAAFSQLLGEILNSWGVPEVSTVSFDAETGEMSTNGVPRASHGKGMRALMHAAFTIGLAQWCITRGLPHPGFVVLDSPLLTYKEPETAEDVLLAQSTVSTQFFRYLDSTFEGQAVVLENVAPPSLGKLAKVYEFTKGSRGRYGFFPRWQDDDGETLF